MGKYDHYDFVIGLDMSLNASGIAVWDRITQTIQTQTIDPGKRRGMERLKFIQEEILKIVPRHSCPLILIEGYAFARANQAHQLGELGGITRMTLYERDLPYVEIPPMRLKKFVSGKGNTPKDIVLKECYKRWQADFDDNNQADAYVLVQIGLHLIGATQEKPTKFQKEVLKDITI